MVAKSARFLAPIALAAVGVGIYLIVHSTLATHRATITQSSSRTTTATGRRDARAKPKPKFYVVKPGDTLSSIAAKTGVQLSQLTSLNPSVSAPPYSLQAGQRLRLRR
jgi:LysM repeat protein